MKQERSYTSPAAPEELERIIYAYSEAWEGRLETTVDLGAALLRIQPTYGTVARLAFPESDVKNRLDALIAEVQERAGRCLWIVGPGTQPAGLDRRLMSRGFTVFFDCDGLVLEDLTVHIPRSPEVVVEPLSRATVQDYAERCSDAPDPAWHRYLLESAYRYLNSPKREVEIYVALVGGEVAGYSVLRTEPTGVAYLANAMIVKEFRNRGVYSSLTAHRLDVARVAGCTVAFCAAQSKTSAPILIRRGFKPVCRFRYLVPPRTRDSA